MNEETISKEDLFKERIEQAKRIEQLVLELDKYKEVIDKIKERHWKTRRNYVEDLIKLYDKLSELLEEIK